MTTHYWLAILASAIFITPMAYCQMQHDKSEANVRITCIEQRGRWDSSWGGTCVFGN